MVELDFYIRWIVVFIPVFLYAEIHYRIWNLFSRYFKREPEIVTDVPHRLGPGKRLPVFLCVKDADRFPIHLYSVTVKSAEHVLLEKDFNGEFISQGFWYKILPCDVTPLKGEIDVNVFVSYACRGRKVCVNDNYKLTSHKPFSVFVDDVPRPTLPGWILGDMHTHSHLSSDQVEFGAPFDVTAAMARALELDFFAASDHSYDLDDRLDDYLVNDPGLPKWRMLWEQIGSFNKNNKDMLIIPGEELTAGNAKNQNVHHIIFNNKKFWHGWGDSAEKWFRTTPQHNISDVLPRLETDAVSFAAHPVVRPPFVQRLLIRRGIWTDKDLTLPALHGAQFWNGDKEHFLTVGLKKWVQLLLAGYKITLIAGADAHGNFNRFRQIGTPHLSMREEQREIFGTSITGVQINGALSMNSVLEGLKKGRVIVTDGPVAEIRWQSSASGNTRDVGGMSGNSKCGKPVKGGEPRNVHSDHDYRIGDTAHWPANSITLSAASSPGYGELYRIELIHGNISAKKETRKQIMLPSGLYEIAEIVEFEKCPQPGYIRLEVETRIGDQFYHCFTNPIYVD